VGSFRGEVLPPSMFDEEGSTHQIDYVLPVHDTYPSCYRNSTIASGGFSITDMLARSNSFNINGFIFSKLFWMYEKLLISDGVALSSVMW
jgi:hypothetical protein